MTPNQYRKFTIARMLANWPESAPEELAHLPKEFALEAVQELLNLLPMPEAELTPEIAEARKLAVEANREAFQSFLKIGEILLKAKAVKKTEAEFWQFVATYAPMDRDYALLAMQAAQEQP